MRTLPLLLFFLLWPMAAYATPVINELQWMGTDQGTSDEWIELFNPDVADADLSGWKIVTFTSKGTETVAYVFSTGSILEAGQYAVMSRRTADASALSSDSSFVAPDLSLLNSGLLVRLLDENGNVVDQADDGSGTPFAGSNPSGTGAKASMERIDPFLPGMEKENWRTAVASEGFDVLSTTLGTPGFPNSQPDDDADCHDDLSIGIDLQSGEYTGSDKVTLNVQAIALSGTLPVGGCRWFFGDGAESASCNPPVHSYTIPGAYVLRLEVTDACANILTDERAVSVTGEGSAALRPAYDDGSRLILKAALPNPAGSDQGREWIEVMNPGKTPVDLAGWRLKIGETNSKWIRVRGVVDAGRVLRIYSSEQSFTLPNSASVICLVHIGDECRSSLEWGKAQEDREYYSTDLRDTDVTGRMTSVIGSTVFGMQLDEAASAVLGESLVYVKLLGINQLPISDAAQQSERREILKALLENKKIELEFDTEMWDDVGRLRAYAYTDQQVSVQEQLLVTGQWMVDRSIGFVKDDLFFSIEKKDVVAALYEEEGDVGITSDADVASLPLLDPNWQKISISEIFPSPSPDDQTGFLSYEWIEVASESLEPVSLSGFVIRSGSRTTVLRNIIVEPGRFWVIGLSGSSLRLKNDGAVVELFSPDGAQVDTLEYPKIPHASSLIRTGKDGVCITTAPTPFSENFCYRPAPQKNSAKASPAVRGYASFYASQLHADTGGEITIAAEQNTSVSAMMLTLSFCLGLGFGLIPIITRRKDA